MNISTLWVSVKADIDNLLSGLKKAESATDQSSDKMQDSAGKVSAAWSDVGGAIAGALNTAALLGFVKSVTDTAAASEAATKRINLVFGQAAGTVEDWAKKNSAAMGLTSKEAASLAATAGASFKAIGLGANDVAKLSTQVLDLAAANSAWTGGQKDTAEMVEVINAALRGETDSLQELGYQIDSAMIQAELQRAGKDKLTGAALKQAESETALAIIQAQSTDKLKAYTEGTNSAASAQKQITANLKEVHQQISEAFLPAISAVIGKVRDASAWFTSLPVGVKTTIVSVLGLTSAVLAAVPVLGAMTAGVKTIGPAMTAAGVAVRGAMTTIGASISGALLPITAVVAAVAALYLAYRNNFLGIRDFLKPVIDNIVVIFNRIVDGIKFVIYNSGTLWKGFTDAFKLTVTTIGSIVNGLGKILSGVGLIIRGAFIEPWIPVFQNLERVGKSIGTGLSNLVQRIAKTLSPLFNLLKSMGLKVGEALEFALNSVGGFFGNLFDKTANQLQANLNEAAKKNDSVAQGVQKVKEGWDDVAGSVGNYKNQLAGIMKTTEGQLRTPPAGYVPNFGLPQAPTTPTTSYSASNPSQFASYGVDSSAAGKAEKDASDKAEKAAADAKARTQAIRDQSNALKDLIADQKKLVASGAITQEQATAYARKVRDLTNTYKDNGTATNGIIKGLLASAQGYVKVSDAAAKAHAKNLAAMEAARKAKEQGAKDDKANADVTASVNAVKKAMENVKGLVIGDKITTQQAKAYADSINTIKDNVKKLGIENNSTVKLILGQATAYASVALEAGKANDAEAARNKEKARHDAAQAKLDSDLKARGSNLAAKAKEWSDEEIASKIKSLEASKDYGKQKLIEILQAEQTRRVRIAEQEASDNLTKSMERLLEVSRKVDAVRESMLKNSAATSLDTEARNLDTKMQAELAAVEGNEAATLEVKKKYAPLFLAVEEKRIDADKQAKLDSLQEVYDAEIAEAALVGADTTELTKVYTAARVAVEANATAQINGLRSKSASDLARQQIALDKSVVDARIKENTTAADAAVEDYLTGIEDLDLAGINIVISNLEVLRDLFVSLGDSGAEAVTKIDAAIKKAKATSSDKSSAIFGFLDTLKTESADLDKEFTQITQDPDSRDTFIQNGLKDFDALIAKYDKLIDAARAYAETLRASGDLVGYKEFMSEVNGLSNVRSGIYNARDNKAVELGNQYDTNNEPAFEEDTSNPEEDAKKSMEIDNSIRNNQLSNASAVADFKLKKLDDEKNAKLDAAKTDEERYKIEVEYLDRTKAARLEVLNARKAADDESLRQERESALAQEGLNYKQIDALNAYYDSKQNLINETYSYERDEIDKTTVKAEDAQKRLHDAFKDFVKSFTDSISSAFKTIYENTEKLNSGTYKTQEDYDKSAKDTAEANRKAAEGAGVGIFNAAVTGLKAVFPQFAYFIDLIGGLLGNMPQLGVVFQKVGEIFLVLMDAIAPVIELLATVLEPFLNIIKVLFESVLKPMIPVLTFFLNIVAGIVSAVYNVIKTVWNAIANFLNGIDIMGWKPFNLSTLPELQGVNSANTPSIGESGTVGGTGSSSGGTSTSTNNITNVFYINESSNAEEVARLVERKLIKTMA